MHKFYPRTVYSNQSSHDPLIQRDHPPRTRGTTRTSHQFSIPLARYFAHNGSGSSCPRICLANNCTSTLHRPRARSIRGQSFRRAYDNGQGEFLGRLRPSIPRAPYMGFALSRDSNMGDRKEGRVFPLRLPPPQYNSRRSPSMPETSSPSAGQYLSFASSSVLLPASKRERSSCVMSIQR